MKLFSFKLIIVTALIVIPSCLCDNLVQLAEKLGATTLVQFVQDAGLADTLANGGPFTVFGPSNDAFARLPEPVVDALKKDKELLARVLEFHVVKGEVLSTSLKNEMVVPTLNTAADIRINIYHDKKLITATGSPVVLPDQKASNGVIHVINRVMFPLPLADLVSTVVKESNLTTLVKAVTAAKLATTLSGSGPFTLFAPTNEAFSKLPPGTLDHLLQNVTALTDVLTYHIVSGTFYSAGLEDNMTPNTIEGKPITIRLGSGGVMVNQAKVVVADQAVMNGVYHVIDSVLLPPMYV